MFVVRRTPVARPLTVVVAAALVGVALTGCTGLAISGECDPAYQPGDASDAVTVTGDVGGEREVEFPTPLIADEVQRSVVVAGEGQPIEPGMVALVSATILDGTSESLPAEGTALVAANDSWLALGESLVCARAGSRLALVGAPDALGVNSSGATAVTVLDIEQVFLGKANGLNQIPQDGLPTVVTAVDGTPGIAVGYATVPDEARTAVIKAGSGAEVAVGDAIVYHLRTWNWPASGTPTVGDDDTWQTFRPQQAEVTDSDDPLMSAIAGQKVGSQVLVVVPGEAGAAATVYVIDLLGIHAAD